MTLDDVGIGQSAKIKKIKCNQVKKRRFFDLGLVKDADITKMRESPAGDPTAYKVKETVIAIRKEDAKRIEVSSK